VLIVFQDGTTYDSTRYFDSSLPERSAWPGGLDYLCSRIAINLDEFVSRHRIALAERCFAFDDFNNPRSDAIFIGGGRCTHPADTKTCGLLDSRYRHAIRVHGGQANSEFDTLAIFELFLPFGFARSTDSASIEDR